MDKNKELKELKQELKYNELAKFYIEKRDQLLELSLNAFLRQEKTSKEFDKEWIRVNKIIDENSWIILWGATKHFDSIIKRLKKRIRILESL